MILLDGKKIANEETNRLKDIVSKMNKKPKMLIVQVGNLLPSNTYIKNKIKKGEEIGVKVDHIKFRRNINEKNLIKSINERQFKYDGVIVQLPLPQHINSQNILDAIDPTKDIDGLSKINMNNFYNDEGKFFIPATARGVLLMLQYYKIDLFQNILVIGESNLVGKPIKKIMSKYAKSIESRNKKTGIKNSEDYDILIVAAGSPELIKKDNVKNGAVIVDVGITIDKNNKLVGDVDFEDVKSKVNAISPVPGGVGPLTVISLFMNLIDKII